jgi:hypothetical protein
MVRNGTSCYVTPIQNWEVRLGMTTTRPACPPKTLTEISMQSSMHQANTHTYTSILARVSVGNPSSGYMLKVCRGERLVFSFKTPQRHFALLAPSVVDHQAPASTSECGGHFSQTSSATLVPPTLPIFTEARMDNTLAPL